MYLNILWFSDFHVQWNIIVIVIYIQLSSLTFIWALNIYKTLNIHIIYLPFQSCSWLLASSSMDPREMVSIGHLQWLSYQAYSAWWLVSSQLSRCGSLEWGCRDAHLELPMFTNWHFSSNMYNVCCIENLQVIWLKLIIDSFTDAVPCRKGAKQMMTLSRHPCFLFGGASSCKFRNIICKADISKNISKISC